MTANNGINKRIKQLKDHYNFSFSQFAEKTDISISTLSNYLGAQERQPRYDIIEKIAKAFPDLDLNWLIRGEGKMFIEESNTLDTNLITFKRQEVFELRRENRRLEANLILLKFSANSKRHTLPKKLTQYSDFLPQKVLLEYYIVGLKHHGQLLEDIYWEQTLKLKIDSQAFLNSLEVKDPYTEIFDHPNINLLSNYTQIIYAFQEHLSLDIIKMIRAFV